MFFIDFFGSFMGLFVVDFIVDSCWFNWIVIFDEDINGELGSYEVYVVKNEFVD